MNFCLYFEQILFGHALWNSKLDKVITFARYKSQDQIKSDAMGFDENFKTSLVTPTHLFLLQSSLDHVDIVNKIRINTPDMKHNSTKW